MFKLDGKIIDITQDLVIGEGPEAITYPAANLLDPEYRAALGIIEVIPEPRPDDRLYWVTDNGDGTYTKVLKKNALSDAIADLGRQIDADTDTIYGAVLGNRGLEYAEAEAEAQAYKLDNYIGAVPAYVQGWADVKQKTPKWAADDILATATAWRTAQISIRSNRLAKKEAARLAADFAALDTVKAEWQGFVALTRGQLGVN